MLIEFQPTRSAMQEHKQLEMFEIFVNSSKRNSPESAWNCSREEANAALKSITKGIPVSELRKISDPLTNESLDVVTALTSSLQNGAAPDLTYPAFAQFGIDRQQKIIWAPGTAELLSTDDNKQRLWLKQNYEFRTALQLLGILPNLTFDDLVKRGVYNYMKPGQKPSGLATWTTSSQPIPDENSNFSLGNHLLEIGPGTGRDLSHYETIPSMQKVVGIDSSKAMLLMAKKEVPNAEFIETDTISGLKILLEQIETGEREKFSAITGFSSLHYFPDQVLLEIYNLINKILEPNGWLIQSTKLPGVPFDKLGLNLLSLRKETDDNTLHTHGRLNPDGQIRFFRNNPALRSLLESIFDVPFQSQITVKDFESGGSQNFGLFAVQKKNN